MCLTCALTAPITHVMRSQMPFFMTTANKIWSNSKKPTGVTIQYVRAYNLHSKSCICSNMVCFEWHYLHTSSTWLLPSPGNLLLTQQYVHSTRSTMQTAFLVGICLSHNTDSFQNLFESLHSSTVIFLAILFHNVLMEVQETSSISILNS